MDTGVKTYSRATVIREADPRDNVAILALLDEALRAGPVFYPPPDLPYALQVLLDSIAQRFVSVAVTRDGEIVGVIVLGVSRWPWTSPSNRAGMFLYNEHLYVLPIWRTRGTAQKLLAWAKGRSDELRLPLMVETSYEDADTGKKEKFIEKFGFRRIGGKLWREPNHAE